MTANCQNTLIPCFFCKKSTFDELSKKFRSGSLSPYKIKSGYNFKLEAKQKYQALTVP